MTSPAPKYLPWPPPGLESVHAKLPPLIAVFLLGDLILVGPLLWAITGDWAFWSPGPFGNSWWLLLFTAVVGLMVMLAAFERLLRLVWLAVRASKRGHRWMTVFQAVSDSPRDTGFVLLGVRAYAGLEASQRADLLNARLLGVACNLVAVLWVPFAFSLSAMLAARGVLGPGAVVAATLLVPGVLLVIAIPVRVRAYLMSRKARRDPDARAAADAAIRGLIVEWNAGIDAASQGVTRASEPVPRAFRWGFAALLIGVIVFAIPAATLGLTSSLGPMAASIALPRFSSLQARVAAANALRRYQITADGAVSEREAGEALHSLLVADSRRALPEMMVAPVRSYETPWFPADGDSVLAGRIGMPVAEITGEDVSEWVLGLFARARDLRGDEREYVRIVAEHPAHVEWGVVARAPAIDMVGTRYVIPFADDLSPWILPILAFTPIRNGTRAHVAKAAWELANGRAQRAEQTIREVISVGLRLVDEAPWLIDNLVGTVLVKDGGRALEELYRVTNRGAEADGLELVRNVVLEVRERSGAGVGFGLQEAARVIPEIVLDSTWVRGLRWEFLLSTSTFSPCMNLRGVLLGPSEEYQQWTERARESLVRRPSEEALFDLLSRGWFAASAERPPLLMRALLGITYGGSQSAKVCGGFLAAADMM